MMRRKLLSSTPSPGCCCPRERPSRPLGLDAARINCLRGVRLRSLGRACSGGGPAIKSCPAPVVVVDQCPACGTGGTAACCFTGKGAEELEAPIRQGLQLLLGRGRRQARHQRPPPPCVRDPAPSSLMPDCYKGSEQGLQGCRALGLVQGTWAARSTCPMASREGFPAHAQQQCAPQVSA